MFRKISIRNTFINRTIRTMSTSFNPQKDIPSLASKVVFITGGTAGLGAGTIQELAKHDPQHIIFSGRNQKKADALIEKVKKASPQVKLSFISCDISSQASVRKGAEEVKRSTDRLDVLMLNAGIMAVPPAVSADGYETQFATNHLGHALLVDLLLPLLKQTAKEHGDARIINMTSVAYTEAPSAGVDFDTIKTDQANMAFVSAIGKWRRYGQSKLAQLLYTDELAKHHPDITSVSIHPGIILTDLFGNVDFMTKLPVLLMSLGKKTPVEQGHYNQTWAATVDKNKLQNGGYYEPIGVIGKRSTALARDEQLARKIWDWTQTAIHA